MNWLYDKFSELAIAELEKVVPPARAGASRQPVTVAVDGAPAMRPAPVPPSASTALDPLPRSRRTGFERATPVDRVGAVPGLDERGRSVYRDWLTRRSPRAFVIAADGRFNATWGRFPRDPVDPRDPAERALKQCRAAGKIGCTLYAVDDRVVYNPDEAEAARR